MLQVLLLESKANELTCTCQDGTPSMFLVVRSLWRFRWTDSTFLVNIQETEVQWLTSTSRSFWIGVMGDETCSFTAASFQWYPIPALPCVGIYSLPMWIEATHVTPQFPPTPGRLSIQMLQLGTRVLKKHCGCLEYINFSKFPSVYSVSGWVISVPLFWARLLSSHNGVLNGYPELYVRTGSAGCGVSITCSGKDISSQCRFTSLDIVYVTLPSP